MTVLFKERFDNIGNQMWVTDIVSGVNGNVVIENHKLSIYGSGVVANALGFEIKIPNTNLVSTNGNFLQFDFSTPQGLTDCVFVASLKKTTGLDYANAVSIVVVSETPTITLYDYGGNPVAGGTPVTSFTFGITYTFLFKFNNLGTVQAYVKKEGGSYVSLGTTVIATDLNLGPIFFSGQQTFIAPVSLPSMWDDIIYQNDGLTFNKSSIVDWKVTERLYDMDYKVFDEGTASTAIGNGLGIGDILKRLVIIPKTLNANSVTLQDGDDETFIVFFGGTASVTSLEPINVFLNLKSRRGPWFITTGANVKAVAIGKFT